MKPQISIVMPAHNRGSRLARTLLALAAQTAPPDSYELILVADGCTDDTAEVFKKTAVPYRARLLEQPGLGAATARNRGVELAAAPLILFLDDDMEATPGLIAAHLAEHAAHPGSLVLGYFPIPAGSVEDNPFAQAVREWWDAGFEARRHPSYRFTFRDFCTGNISLPADLFRSAGGFYPRIQAAGGEDWELGVRLLKAGARFRFAPNAVSLHHDYTSFDRALQRSRNEGLAHVLLVQRHPELFWSFNLHRLSRLQAAPFTPLWRLLWRRPGLADRAAACLRYGLKLLYRLGWDRLMLRFYPALAGHAYWRGVHTGLGGSLPAWERLNQDAPLEPELPREIDIDLATDLRHLDAILEREHADSVRLSCRGEPLGRICPVPGAERLSGVHVREEAMVRFPGLLLSLLISAQQDGHPHESEHGKAFPLARAVCEPV